MKRRNKWSKQLNKQSNQFKFKLIIHNNKKDLKNKRSHIIKHQYKIKFK